MHAPVNALAHLTADLPESAPSKAQMREHPLEKGDALAVFHTAQPPSWPATQTDPFVCSGATKMAMIMKSGWVAAGEATDMASRSIPQKEWQAFFDGLADALVGKRVEVEAASLDLGDQIVAEWVPLQGVTYDAKDDLLDVALSGLNHLIRRPKEIYVQDGPTGVETIAVVSADGVKQILHLKDPLMLPAADRRER
jgi:hypothetical protein